MENIIPPRQPTAPSARVSAPNMVRKQKQPPSSMAMKHPVKQPRTGGGLIQSNSIQQQFASLSNDRDKFRKEKDQAELALARIQAEYQTLKKDHDDLIMKNLRAKAELGTYTKKLDMLKEEEKRIARNLENDTKAVENCTNHLKALESRKEEKEKKFVAYLNPVTVEIAIFLQKRVEKKVEERITVETVSSVMLPFLRAKQQEGCPELQNGLFGLEDSIDKLKEATSSRDEAIEQLRELLVQFQDCGVDLDVLMEGILVPTQPSKLTDDANNHPEAKDAAKNTDSSFDAHVYDSEMLDASNQNEDESVF
ncbi:hypothetical protein IV203_038035 [Nitzschia inconspicua]|uniref:Uncharacterized protein n=1 Tax=Nitzschia inconspicua TaxID=303405 RepID=A0A9K3LMP1_9STRA|nr:hypothetical protein IV203_038035 [Nitzschia inconspicua]